MLITNSEHNQRQEINALLKILEKSKDSYNKVKHKTAKPAFSDICVIMRTDMPTLDALFLIRDF